MGAEMSFDFKNATPEARKSEYARIAKKIGDDSFFTKKELNHLPDVLADGEQLIAFSSGIMDGNTWLISLTDRRIILLDKGIIYGLKQISIPLDKINSISGQTGILFGKIKIEDGASERVIDNVLKKTVVPFTNLVRETIEAHKNSHRQPSVLSEDIVSKLERLASLRDRGVLTQQEFEQQKAKLL